jgi:hypothetical protein
MALGIAVAPRECVAVMLRKTLAIWLLVLAASPCTAPFSVADMSELFGCTSPVPLSRGVVSPPRPAASPEVLPMRTVRMPRLRVAKSLSLVNAPPSGHRIVLDVTERRSPRVSDVRSAHGGPPPVLRV